MSEITLSGKIENMSDTNKLLWLILQELRRLNPSGQVINQPEEKNVPTTQILAVEENDGKKEQHQCKYCGEMVEGNRGNLLAHIRNKCPARKG